MTNQKSKIKNQNEGRIIFIILIFVFCLLNFSPALAAPRPNLNLLPACAETGNCGVCDILDTVGHIFIFALSLLAAVAMFYLIWAAFDIASAHGNPEKLQEGKKKAVGVIWGIMWVLIAWTVSNLTIAVLRNPTGGEEAKKFAEEGKQFKEGKIPSLNIFGKPWNVFCEEKDAGKNNECVNLGGGVPCETKDGNNGVCQSGQCVSTD